ncbi:hypothetical protein [Nocardia wallacei]|uniref:Lipoprotein n=1 Tax=Nocardia wallacei TaxID=480035 RepID=A0A7G1KVL5_9NOCA|nr:hypothetical protein [Nocardia wallacei]BCK59122.1 hypothetical protein NWFMUON74_68940 [Nocardia wallacei]
MSPRSLAACTIALTAVTLLPGCASHLEATPEVRIFPFAGSTLDVESHDVPTDLVVSNRGDIKVTRWFSARSGAKEQSWTLENGRLDLVARCGGFANCDARFEVEVPPTITVLRSGKPTNLRGA